jgi:uncharacterized protein YecE (DUF72 family)
VISVGTCGFSKSRAEVSGKLQAVEIQDSFYKHVEPATAKRWRRDSSKGFLFSVKASQLITHDPSSPTYRKSDIARDTRLAAKYGSFKPTREVMAAWRKTEETCRILDARAVLFQTPASFEPTAENIENIGKFMQRAETKMIRAWEPRDGWPREYVEEICSRHKIVHCVDPFAEEPVTAKVAYFRLHGKPPGSRNYYYTYSDQELAWLRDRCVVFDEVYVFFNNISMFADAVRFRGLAGVQG